MTLAELQDKWERLHPVDRRGQTLLHYAVMGGYTEIVKTLKKDGADPNETDENRRTALHWATANQNDLALLQVLLDAGADPNAQNAWGETPLHLAQSEEAYDLLLRMGADPNIKNMAGYTPDRAERKG